MGQRILVLWVSNTRIGWTRYCVIWSLDNWWTILGTSLKQKDSFNSSLNGGHLWAKFQTHEEALIEMLNKWLIRPKERAKEGKVKEGKRFRYLFITRIRYNFFLSLSFQYIHTYIIFRITQCNNFNFILLNENLFLFHNYFLPCQ